MFIESRNGKEAKGKKRGGKRKNKKQKRRSVRLKLGESNTYHIPILMLCHVVSCPTRVLLLFRRVRASEPQTEDERKIRIQSNQENEPTSKAANNACMWVTLLPLGG